MIPETLKLANFMCYREEASLSFEGIRLACLCGDNGSGKSALLDAITWALWGRSRADSDDELVSTGQKETSVELDFASTANRYKVLRKHVKDARGRSGKKLLELFVRDGKILRPITGNTLSETQQKIIQILGLDYNTFINSAFIRQGHADEFTTKTSGERKKVLASILNLSIYDGLETRARELARNKERNKLDLQKRIEEIYKALEHQKEYEEQHQAKEKVIAGLAQNILTVESELADLKKQVQILQLRSQDLAESRQKKVQLEREIAEYRRQIGDNQKRLEQAAKIIENKNHIETNYQLLLAARKQNDEFNAKLQSLMQLIHERNSLENKINGARSDINSHIRVTEFQIKEFENKRQALPALLVQLKEAQAKLAGLSEIETGLETDRQKQQEIISQLNLYKTTNQNLTGDIKLIREKMALLAESGVKCPLCETELGRDGRLNIEKKYQNELAEKIQLFENNKKILTQFERERETIARGAGQKELALKSEKPRAQNQLARLSKEIEEIQTGENTSDGLRKELLQWQEKLAGGDFSRDEHIALEQVQQRITALGYDEKFHGEIKARLLEYKDYESLKQKLLEAEQNKLHLETAVAQQQEILNQKQTSSTELEKKIADIEKETYRLAQLEQQIRQAESNLGQLKLRQTEEQRSLWEIESAIKKCREMESEKRDKEKELGEILQDISIHDELAQAFGKRGLQAFIIESVLPELENEANTLLGRMTDNRMTLKIETQKEYKSKPGGDPQETLEIKIGDEMGTRNYEMYSGGEAFRINFALRVALSRLLARRAGAPLRTLVIDEGFGTQDVRGIDNLVEAITSIQDDFDKILVITHMEELKDQFPVRINVVKSGTGSKISVN